MQQTRDGLHAVDVTLASSKAVGVDHHGYGGAPRRLRTNSQPTDERRGRGRTGHGNDATQQTEQVKRGGVKRGGEGERRGMRG